LKNAILRRG